MTKLSSSAQAVLNAVCDNTEPDCDTQHLIAAALRAAADQGENFYDPHEGKVSVVRVDLLIAIAAELEGQYNDSIPHRLNKESDY